MKQFSEKTTMNIVLIVIALVIFFLGAFVNQELIKSRFDEEMSKDNQWGTDTDCEVRCYIIYGGCNDKCYH